MTEQYEDFKLTVFGSQGKYTVQAEGPGGINIDPFPFTLEKTQTLVSKIEHLKWGLDYPDATPAELMREVGTSLFDVLFPRKIIRAFERSYQAAPNLRMKLRIVPLELNDLPWELLYDPDDERHLAARSSMPIVRMIESSSGVRPWEGLSNPRILYVQANPGSTRELGTSQSEQAIRDAFANVDSIHQAKPDDLQTSLLNKYDILHYDGHAKFDQKQDTGHLYLHDNEGKEHKVGGRLLSTYLDGAGLKLVVLAACETAVEDKEKSFSGIAQQLMHTVEDLPAVVAMQFAIPDASAIAFTRGFYRALAAGRKVDIATVEGRKAILGILKEKPFDSPDWFTPVVYMHSEEQKKTPERLIDQAKTTTFDQRNQTVKGKQYNVGSIQGDNVHLGDQINTSSGDYVGGDKIQGDKVGGDKIGGDKYEGINISGIQGSSIAFGRGSKATVTHHHGQTGSDNLATLFAPLQQLVANQNPSFSPKVNALKEQAALGSSADDETVAELIEEISDNVPGAKPIISNLFNNPIITNAIGPATKYVLKRL